MSAQMAATVSRIWRSSSLGIRSRVRFTGGSSCEDVHAWTFAGAGWQGRSEGRVALPHDRARTPPGGDQRAFQACADLQDGPLALAPHLKRQLQFEASLSVLQLLGPEHLLELAEAVAERLHVDVEG